MLMTLLAPGAGAQTKRVAVRTEFAARALGALASASSGAGDGTEGPGAATRLVEAGAVPLLLDLLEVGADKGAHIRAACPIPHAK
jgi:hypothetical protein